ncbi:hypothetical protein PYW08_006395 [Mythimna loreyi]|uniref:Uncharacterized protein n=1 Tax=Mythimna loreyi TaxID=667449 RepID=A0ACC2QRK9_9NEOP|nr:hypothetical protein PYW08_006395 [Mythimna loreyi]
MTLDNLWGYESSGGRRRRNSSSCLPDGRVSAHRARSYLVAVPSAKSEGHALRRYSQQNIRKPPSSTLRQGLPKGLPNDLSVYWHQYPYGLGIVFCKLRALISEAATYVSVLTISAFSLERYLAICHPLHLYTMAGLTRASRIILILWIISIVCASPFAVYSEISYRDYPPSLVSTYNV